MPEITISDDGLQAIVDSVGPKTTSEEIVTALNATGVTEGMKTSAIVEALTEVVAAGGSSPRFTK